MITSVLWDLDGTLADTEGLHAELERGVLIDLGLLDADVDALMARPERVGLSSRDAFLGALEVVGRSELLDDAMAMLQQRLVTQVVDRAQPKQGVNRVLLDIPMRETRFAIVTSSRRSTTEELVERFGWAWRFEVLVTADDVVRRKPDPEPYLQACDQLGITPAQALAVEDSPHGIASARAAGVKCAAVVGSFQPDALGQANWVISGVGAVPGLLGILRRPAGRGRGA